MEQALRAMEKLMEDQRGRLQDIQRGHAQLEQALVQMRAQEAKSRASNSGNEQRASAEYGSGNRRRTPPPSTVDGPEQPPARSQQRNPMVAEPSPDEADETCRTPRTEGSLRTPRGSMRSEAERTPRSQRGEAEVSSMARSGTEPVVSTKLYKSFKDDPRYKETGKEYGEWPPYPEWQDMPLRKFGAGYGKKCQTGQKATGSHFTSGGGLLNQKGEDYTWHSSHGDAELVDGMVRSIGHGRRKFVADIHGGHLHPGCVPKSGKEDFAKHGHSRENDLGEDGLEYFLGHGKHHWFVKDHLNDESTTEGSSSAVSRPTRSREEDRSNRSSSGASSRARSAR